MKPQESNIKKNTLIITGLSLDKRESARIHKQMAKDRDIRLFLNPFGLFKVMILNHPKLKYLIYFLGTLIVYFVTQVVTELLSAWIIHRPIDIIDNILNIAGFIVAIGLWVYGTIKKSLSHIDLNIPKTDFKKYVQFIRAFKKPLDIWNLFVANISDAQTAIPFFKESIKNEEKTGESTSSTELAFTGVPYYDVVFIDSIYLEIYCNKEDDKEIKRALWGIKRRAKKLKKKLITELKINYLNEFAVESGASVKNVSLKEEYERDPANLFSGFVFGIRFLSKFFFNITGGDDEKSNLHTLHDGGRVKVSMSISDDISKSISDYMSKLISDDISKSISDDIKMSKSIEEALKQAKALKQAVDLSTCNLFDWNSQKEKNRIRIKVGMTKIGTKSYDYSYLRRKRYIRKGSPIGEYVPPRQVIRIPFKRPIAVPAVPKNSVPDKIDLEGILPCQNEPILNDTNKTDLERILPFQIKPILNDTNIFFVGGAEHNLAFLCALREYRKEHSDPDNAEERIGILENEYDYKYHPAKTEERPILISAEKLVQSFYVTNGNQAAAKKFNYSYVGELVRFTLNNEQNFYSFFGYSAPMTKIISAFLAKDKEFYIDKLFQKVENDKRLNMERMILVFYNDITKPAIGNDADNINSRKINKFPALEIWDDNDFINIGECLESPVASSENWKKLIYKEDEIILINSSNNLELSELEQALNDSPF